MADFGLQGLDPKFYFDKLNSTIQKDEQKETGGEEFGSFLNSAINQVNEIQKSADAQISKVIKGEVEDIHTAMVELNKADISFQAMMEVRNKILEAYQEVMRMQV